MARREGEGVARERVRRGLCVEEGVFGFVKESGVWNVRKDVAVCGGGALWRRVWCLVRVVCLGVEGGCRCRNERRLTIQRFH